MIWGVAGLWTVFALLVLLGAGEFLFACSLEIGRHAWSYCPAPIDRATSFAEAERGERLQRLVHAAEMTLAEKPPCVAQSPPQTESEEFHREEYKSLKRGGHEGKVEVFLTWNTLDDLDLEVSCAGGGQIGGQRGRPGSCGEAKLDVDANRNLKKNVTNMPEEHVVWASSIPDGQFKVEAFIFKVVNSNVRQTVPFVMTFKIDDKVKKCSGEVTMFPQSEGLKTSNGKPLSARDPYMTWTPGEGLPTSCEWQTDEGYWCEPGECAKP